MPVRKGAPSQEARAAAGHDPLQWERFYAVTREEAKKIVQKFPGITWPNVPSPIRSEVRSCVNASLASESIPAVEDDVLGWRMALAIRDARTVANRYPQSQSQASRATSADAPRPSQTRPYDPVRDQ
ncbi:uncharacterized protein EI97DRAFT_427104 [Westerdykella ornata]|uniref:Uncharacterized protein n=1 Tax=Westerdykella ornata TaxID=318751 RepID=A0A6A6J772_WESOR|nr:uncharacterized protein EI97DRAFT_427104 [Westerdykella ornata]KAF2272003.1 hypothetical protein EI97DRAFT_427104 [Westerdykella ornata]